MKKKIFSDIGLTLVARIVPGLLSLLAVPFFVRTLGSDRYASVGLFISVQMIIGLLDMGMSAGVLRETSWLMGRAAQPGTFASLLRTFEIPFWLVSFAVCLFGLTCGSSLLEAVFGVEVLKLGLSSEDGFLLFAAVGARFPFAVYLGFLSGRGRIARANLIVIAFDVMRTGGIVILFLLFGGSMTLFFGWQMLVSLLLSLVGRAFAWREVSLHKKRAAIDWSFFWDARALVLGSGFMSVLFVVANGIDKLLLPRFLSARDFGSYVAISQLAVIVFIISHAIWAAFHPRLLVAIAGGDKDGAKELYELAATGMVATGVGAITISGVSGPALVGFWMGDGANLVDFSLVLTILILGYTAAALSHLAISIQQAAKTMAPVVSVLAGSVVIVPLLAYQFLRGFTPVTGALTWAGIYCLFLLGGGVVYRRYGAVFVSSWLRHVIMPLLVVIFLSMVLSEWSHQLGAVTQLCLGFLVAVILSLGVLVGNAQVRCAAYAYIRKIAR